METFIKLTESMKIGFGIVCAFFIQFFGVSRKYIYLLLILMAFDTLLGWIAAKKEKNWTSYRAKWGFAGKIITLMLIALLYVIDYTFDLDFLKYTGIFYYSVVEIASVFENLALIENISLPDGLPELLQKLKQNTGNSVLKTIKKLIAEFTGIEIKEDQEKQEKK